MSSATRQPRAYRPSLWARLADGLRSNYGIGQWSWLAHRVTGLGVLLFLVVHIIDTFFVVAYPGLYDHTVSLYSGRVPWVLDSSGQPTYFWPIRWIFRISELALIACVLFHSVNGVRVAMVDLWPKAVEHQKLLFRWVVGVFVFVMLVVSYFVFKPLLEDPRPHFWNMPGEHGASSGVSRGFE
jgi:succinate dehydrogenase / fumarate reductase cytochrome b subunit